MKATSEILQGHPLSWCRFCRSAIIALAWMVSDVLAVHAATFTLGTSSLVMGPAAGTNSVVLAVTPNSATWTATTNATWLHLTAAFQSGTGSTNVIFSYDTNASATRTGTLTIAGQTLTITQAGSTYVAAQTAFALVSTGLNQPQTLAVDGSGNVYFADSDNNAIKEWTPANNTVTTLVSSGLSSPAGVAVDEAGDVYIADSGNNAIKERSIANSNVTTLVSSGLNSPSGVAVDGFGNVYIADYNNNAIKEWVAASNAVTTLVSSGILNPSGLALDAAGNVYIANTGNRVIQEWRAANKTMATLESAWVYGVAVDGAGNVYSADYGNGGPNELIELTVATGAQTALVSDLSFPTGAAVDGAGNVYIADPGDNVIEELPHAFVDATPRSESFAAGNDTLPVVVPATANLLPPFAPSSTQSWLTISGITNGVLSFAFTTNNTGAIRTADISLLGQTIVITQSAEPPLTTTLPATGIAVSSATLHASVNPEGSATTVYFAYGTTTNYGSTNTVSNIGSGTNALSISNNATGLLPGSTYHFVTIASNNVGTALGGDLTFTTLVVGPPLATTQPATAITSNSATLNATVNPEAAATTVYFAYGTSTKYGSTNVVGSIGSGYTALSVSNNATGLLPGIVYHFEVIASNSSGTASGGDLTFDIPVAPEAATQPATAITNISAHLNASVNPEGAATTVYFAYGTSTNYGSTNIVANIGSGFGALSITNKAAGLLPSTVYHFAAIASNSAGTDFGGDLTFTTEPPTYSLGTSELLLGPAAGTHSVVLAVSPNLSAWTSKTNASWLHLASAFQSGTGSTNVVFSCDANPGTTRTGTLTIAGQTLTVTQAGSTYVAAGALAKLVSSGLDQPQTLAVDGSGNVYIADTLHNAIKKWTVANNAVTTLVSSGLSGPEGVAVDGMGNVYIADSGNNAIKKWTVASNKVTTLVSSGLNSPTGVAVDGAGNVYIANNGANAIKEWIAASNAVATLVSSGLNDPLGVAVDGAGNVYIADTGNNAIKEWVAANHNVATLVALNLTSPAGVAVDDEGNVYIADTGDAAIDMWDAASSNVATLDFSGLNTPTGVAVDVAGNVYFALASITGNGQAATGLIQKWTAASNITSTLVSGLYIPFGVAVDGAGNVYFVDSYKSTLSEWIVASNTVITLVSLGLSGPAGIALDAAGNVYIADGGDGEINEWIAANGTLITLASGIETPLGVAVDGAGNVYAANAAYNTIGYGSLLEWTAASGALTVLASGLSGPSGVAVDATGNVYIADTAYNQVDELPYAFVDPTSLSEGAAGGNDVLRVVLPVTENLGPPFTPTSDQPWLAVGGVTNGVVDFSFTTNTGPSRTACINLLGQNISVTQGDLPYYLSTYALFETANAGSDGVALTVAPGSGAWTATANAAWLHLDLADQSGTDSTNISFSFDANTGTTRSGTITIAGQTLGVTQYGPTVFSLSTNALMVTAAAGTNDVVLTVVPNIASWTATANATWLHLSTANQSGTGSTNVVFSFDANQDATRSGTLTIGDQTLTVTQAGLTFILGATARLEGPAAGIDSVVLAVVPNVGIWTAITNAGWLHLSPGNQSGTGGTNVVFSFDSNPAATRTGTLTIAGQTLTVTQAGSNYVAAGEVTELVHLGLNLPGGVAVDGSGNVYIADTGDNAIKEWVPSKNSVTTLVSSGLNSPIGLALDASGNVYFADTGNNAIKRWTAANSNVTTVLSTGLTALYGVAVDSSGNLYLAEDYANQFYDNTPTIYEWTASTSNLTALLVERQLPYPDCVAIDAAGNLYIGNAAVYKWTAANQSLITLVPAGGNGPSYTAVDGAGNVYYIYNPSPAGSTINEWIAANSTVTKLVSASKGLNGPASVAVDGADNVYIADTGNNAIKELPHAFVDPAPKLEGAAAGTDSLPVVLPVTENLLAPFVPTVSQSWLAITGITNGVVSFSFTSTTSNRTASITLLGLSIPVTQVSAASPPTLALVPEQNGGSLQFAFGSTLTTTFTVLSSTNLSLPLTNWTVVGIASNVGPDLFEFTSQVTTNDSQRYYVVRSP